MRVLPAILIAVSVLLLAGEVKAKAKDSVALPPGVTVPKDYKLPGDVNVQVYLPARNRRNRGVSANGATPPPGNVIETGITSALQSFFTRGSLVPADHKEPYGLLIAAHTDVKFESGVITTILSYSVFGADSKPLLVGKQSAPNKVGGIPNIVEALRKGWLRSAQLMMADIVTQLRPDAAKFPPTTTVAALPREAITDRENAVSSGTGFFFNAAGQVLTAAHVVNDCVLVEVSRDGKTQLTKNVASSNLLDLAVLDTGTPVQRFLPFRKGGEIVLGEGVTNVGFPLQKILAASPNLTRGNVSSRGALEGSVGQFQFSAPIQPGSSGGPVVSDGGELLGVTVGTLNALQLVKDGVLPQNVNFALDAQYAVKFLRQHGVAFNEVEPNFKGDMRVANDAALATVVAIKCYQ